MTSEKSSRLQSLRIFALLTLTSILIAGCGAGKFRVPERIPNDQRPGLEPAAASINVGANGFEQQIAAQVRQALDLSYHLRKLAGRPRQAMNIDAFGEVHDCSWFTNRNAIKRMSLEEIARGPNSGNGPDTSGVWTVIRAKVEGITPGFHIEDSQGVCYVIKFDTAGYPELATGAEVASTKLFHAMGYNVPENYIVNFNPANLRVGAQVRFTDEKGLKCFMTQQDLDTILQGIQRLPDGRIRAVASKYIAGKLKGPFRYTGVRKDDPNDVIPHEHRRELRGLQVVSAWLNHYDTKANNSLDVYVEEGYMRHYLIDFGSTLGSRAGKPKPPVCGYENDADPHEMTRNILLLGLWPRPWEQVEPVRHPSVGYFRSDIFHPRKYKGIIPNPAFENMTRQDGYWGAKLVMSFTDEQLSAAVAEGQYSDPEAASYILKTIIERRDIVGRYWFSKVNPLDRFELRKPPDGRRELHFVDLAVESGLESADQSEYRCDLIRAGKRVREIEMSDQIRIPLEIRDTNGLWELRIYTRRGSDSKWMKPVRVYLRWENISRTVILVGVQH
ncbi:hypothetical protein ACFL6S_24550 [Candidatus Poribacteria bacterium]